MTEISGFVKNGWVLPV